MGTALTEIQHDGKTIVRGSAVSPSTFGGKAAWNDLLAVKAVTDEDNALTPGGEAVAALQAQVEELQAKLDAAEAAEKERVEAVQAEAEAADKERAEAAKAEAAAAKAEAAKK